MKRLIGSTALAICLGLMLVLAGAMHQPAAAQEASAASRYKTVVHYLENADASKLVAVLNAVYSPGSGGALGLGNQGVSIVADIGTNSLVISAPTDAIEAVMETVKKLDIAPFQVLIECVILEVRLDNMDNLGVDWTYKNTNIDFGIRPAVPGMGVLEALNFTGLKQGVIGDQRTLQGVIQALVRDNRTRIVATPRIFAANNREATIEIGDNVPVLLSQATTTGGVTQSTFTYKDVGIKLSVTPHINRRRQTVLEISQEIKSFFDMTSLPTGVNVTNQNPIITTRASKTVVTLGDSEAVIIGGLIRTDMGRVESKIPLLGDIPILGAAFRSKSFREQKTELLIFITTRVVTTSDEMRRMTVDQIDDSTYYDQRAREFFSDAHPVRDAVEFMERNIGQ
jgi:general secretion pathway protein D